MSSASPPTAAIVAKHPRIALLDLARGAALIAMAIYHFTWDLEFFGYVDPGMTAHGGWKLFARCIASSFLFLVGVSLFLAHASGIRWRGFLIRLAMVGGAALAISRHHLFRGARRLHLLRHPARDRAGEPARAGLPAAAGAGHAGRSRPLVIAAPLLRALGAVRSSLAGGGSACPADRSALQRLRAASSRGSARCSPASGWRSSPRHFGLLERLAGLKRPSPRPAAIRRTPQPCLLPHPPARADRLRLAVRADLPGRDSRAARCSSANPARPNARTSATKSSARAIVCACWTSSKPTGRPTPSFADEQSAAERAQLQNLAAICTERTDEIMSEGGQP